MDSKDTEIQELKRNIFLLQRQLEHNAKPLMQDFYRHLPFRIQSYIREQYIPQLFKEGYSPDISEKMQQRIINRVNDYMPKGIISDMKQFDLIDINNNITSKGINLIHYLV